MKRITLLLIGLCFIFTSCSYEPGVSEAMMKYRFKDGVTTLTVPGWAIRLIAGLNELDETEQEIFDAVDKVKVIAVDDAGLNARINLHNEFYHKVNKEGKYEELMSVNDGSEKVTLFGRMEGKVIKEMVILVGGEENALVYVKGEFSPELIQDKVDISNTEKLLSLNF